MIPQLSVNTSLIINVTKSKVLHTIFVRGFLLNNYNISYVLIVRGPLTRLTLKLPRIQWTAPLYSFSDLSG